MRARAITSFARDAALPGVVAGYALVLLLCPGDRLLGFPVHHDDFTNLSTTLSETVAQLYGFSFWLPRPVSYYALSAVSSAGIPFYYLSLHALLIAYVALVLGVLHRLLEVRRMPFVFAAVVAASMLSYEHAVEYSKYTGLITNLLSGTCAAAAMHVMSGAVRRPDQATGSLTSPVIAAIWIAAALSFWSKEDFVLPLVVMGAYMVWERRARTGVVDRRWLALAAGLVMLAGASVVYNAATASPYTNAAAGPYKPSFQIASIVRTTAAYLTMTPTAVLATALQALTLIVNGLAAAPVRWPRLVLFHVLVVSLVLPYACLPNHTAPYYGLNWTAWQMGGALLVVWEVASGVAGRLVVVGVALLALAVGQSTRSSIGQWYQAHAAVNRNIVALLVANRRALEPYRVVAVEGAPMLGPWFASDGRFLRTRYGLDHEWLVRVPADSEYRRRLLEVQGGPAKGSVRTLASDEGPIPPAIPVVRLRDDGTGAVDLP